MVRNLLIIGCILLGVGCVDNPPNTDSDDTDPTLLDPCEVTLDGPLEADDEIDGGEGFDDPFDTTPPRLWRTGPYPVWNTSPADECRSDPTIDTIGIEVIEDDDGNEEEVEHTDVGMYITYPARSESRRTGDGRVADGRFPIVIFAHANNDRICDITRGSSTLHDHWASYGFIVVAIDGSELNCKSGNRQNIELRSAGQLAAIDALRALDVDPESRFYGRLDLESVIFAGHSRGGGASLLSAREYPEALGVIDLQGVDLTGFGFGDDPLPDFPVIGVTAGKDDDLKYPYTEPTEDQLTGRYTWVTINGGIHAYTADIVPLRKNDDPDIHKAVQHDVTQFYTTAFLADLVGVANVADSRAVRRGDSHSVLFSHRGAEVIGEEVTPEGVYVRWRAGDAALWIDDFDSPLRTGDDAETNLLGGENVSVGLERSEEVATYKPDANPRRGVYGKAYSRLLVAAEVPGAFTTYLSEERAPEFVSADASLDARVKGPDEGTPAEFELIVETPDSEIVIDPAGYIGPEPLKERFVQLHVPLSDFVDEELEIVAIRFELVGGSLFVDDLRITNP